jgi:polar amino acid transport system substrate-binding protein
MRRRRAHVPLAATSAVLALVLSACSNSEDAQDAGSAAVSELADAVPEKVRKDGVLTLGIDPNYPPMEYLERGEAIGADLDLMTEVAGRLGLDVEFAEDAYALLVPGVAAGRFEAAISALSVDDVDLQNANMVTYYKAGSQLAIRTPDGKKKRPGPNRLCGRKVGVLDGSLQHSQLVARSSNCIELNRKPIRILTYSAQAPATQAVVDNQVYATLADSPVIENAVRASDGTLAAKGKPFAVKPYGIAVKQGRKRFAHTIRKTLRTMMEDGTYQRILTDWGISGGAIKKPRVLSRDDIPEPTPLFSTTPSP